MPKCASFPHLLKIRKTEKSPEERAKELSKTGVPTPFVVIYKVFTPYYEKIEKSMQDRFENQRNKPDREFFTINPDEAINALIEESQKFSSSIDLMISNEMELIKTIETASRSLVFMGLTLTSISQKLMNRIQDKLNKGLQLEIILPKLSKENINLLHQRDEQQEFSNGDHIKSYEITMKWFTDLENSPKMKNLKLITISQLPFGFIAIIDDEVMFWTPYVPCGLSKNMVLLKVRKSEFTFSHWRFLKKSMEWLKK